MAEVDDIVRGLTKREYEFIVEDWRHLEQDCGWGFGTAWCTSHRHGRVAGSLVRKGLLDRVEQRENPLHERAFRYWLYCRTPLFTEVRARLLSSGGEVVI